MWTPVQGFFGSGTTGTFAALAMCCWLAQMPAGAQCRLDRHSDSAVFKGQGRFHLAELAEPRGAAMAAFFFLFLRERFRSARLGSRGCRQAAASAAASMPPPWSRAYCSLLLYDPPQLPQKSTDPVVDNALGFPHFGSGRRSFESSRGLNVASADFGCFFLKPRQVPPLSQQARHFTLHVAQVERCIALRRLCFLSAARQSSLFRSSCFPGRRKYCFFKARKLWKLTRDALCY